MVDHEILIEKLSRSIEPVQRPWSPGLRVMAWVAMALPSGIAASMLVSRTLTDWSQTGSAGVILQLLLTFVAGTLAVRNAFLISIAGLRPLSWKWFVPLISVWLAITSGNVYFSHSVPAGTAEDTNCYLFMVVVSIPMAVLVIGYLRRTRTLFPAQSLGAAGAGVACMALTLLAFCHPTHVIFQDFLTHIAATTTIVALTILLGYRWVSLP